VDLRFAPEDSFNLRIEGFLGDQLVGLARFDGDRSSDALALVPDDTVLLADGTDATRVTVAVVDRHGRARGQSQAVVEFELEGPGVLVGDRSLDLLQTGAVGAVWVRTRPDEPGSIVLHASAFGFGSEAISLTSTSP
jgi:beta-galactosidase